MSILNLVSIILGCLFTLVLPVRLCSFILHTPYGKACKLTFKLMWKLVTYLTKLVVKATRMFISWAVPILLKRLNRQS